MKINLVMKRKGSEAEVVMECQVSFHHNDWQIHFVSNGNTFLSGTFELMNLTIVLGKFGLL